MVYVLVIAICYGNCRVHVIEYNSLEACKEAGAQIRRDMNQNRNDPYTCTPRGEKK